MVTKDAAASGKNRAGKAAGILCEADGNNVFIGVGVNVEQRKFPEEYRAKAISIAQAAGEIETDWKLPLLEKILFRLYSEIEEKTELSSTWRQRLTARLYKKGENIVFASGAADSNTLIEGTLSGISSTGELLIVPKGEEKERAFITGELRVY